MEKNNIKILAIETSCDETAAAVVESKNGEVKILSNIVNSQIDLHKVFGGVFPEIASKTHVENIIPVIEESLDKSEIRMSKSEKLNDIDVIAVTSGPGLIGSLLVGTNTAKTLAFTKSKPILPINHWLGHIYSTFSGEFPVSSFQFPNKLSNEEKSKTENCELKTENLPQFPLLALIVSGGHTGLVIMKSHTEYETIGQTLDDAAGEAFDKVAKLLELGYPGGPAISAAAEKFTVYSSQFTYKIIPNIKFPRPMIHSGDFNFSFSGLKTSVLNKVRELAQTYTLDEIKNQIAYEFQQAIIDTLITKTLEAANEYKIKSICLCGGVSANKELRDQLASALENWKLETGNSELSLFVPPMHLTGDNAAMIGIAAAYQLANGVEPTTFDQVNANSNLKL
ncbi:MAG: tRNA (adenosine(37)-N6)-threonylcarbamoyltransferase complex transferase subunit TsaD [Candidatus Berkelbacteria bacterium]